MKKVLFLDLDRTLIDTARFMESLWTVMAAAYNADYAREMARVPNFYRSMGDYRYYDLKLHIEEGLGQNADAVLDAVTPLLKKEDFVFADVSELKKWEAHKDYDIRVLTFGPRWVQEFKLRFAPEIAHLPTDIILEAKNDFIAREYAGRTGLLVDDKRNPRLPDGFTEVWLNRDSTMQDEQENGIICINSLTQVEELLV